MDRQVCPQQSPVAEPSASEESAPEEKEATKKPRFLLKDGCWYFSDDDGGLIGPFDKVYDTVLTEWRNTERVLSGAKMSELLAPYQIAA